MIHEKSPQLPQSFSNNYFHPGDVEILVSIKCCGNSNISYPTLYSLLLYLKPTTKITKVSMSELMSSNVDITDFSSFCTFSVCQDLGYEI